MDKKPVPASIPLWVSSLLSPLQRMTSRPFDLSSAKASFILVLKGPQAPHQEAQNKTATFLAAWILAPSTLLYSSS